MRYLLDTNIVSDLVRNPQGRAAEHVRRVGEAQVCTSIIVVAELRYGAAKRGSERLTRQLEAVLGVIDVLPLAASADTVYGQIRTQLEQTGRPTGGNDLLIAAQTVALGYTIVTDDEEFARIDGLPRENWLRREYCANQCVIPPACQPRGAGRTRTARGVPGRDTACRAPLWRA